MKNLKIMIERHPNDHYVGVHLNNRLPSKFTEDELETALAQSLIDRLSAIYGVAEDPHLQRYEISFSMGEVFDLYDVTPRVLDALLDWLVEHADILDDDFKAMIEEGEMRTDHIELTFRDSRRDREYTADGDPMGDKIELEALPPFEWRDLVAEAYRTR